MVLFYVEYIVQKYFDFVLFVTFTWISFIQSRARKTINTTNRKVIFQSSFTSTVCPEIVLYGVQTQSLSKVVDELCGKGLIIFNILKVIQAFPSDSNNSNARGSNKAATATSNPLNNTYIITLRVSSKLYLKLCDVFSKRNHQKMLWEPEESITERERLIRLIRCRICNKVESIIQSITSMRYSHFELLHNEEVLNRCRENSTSGSINNEDTLLLNDYFGPSTTLYFTWLQYLHQCSWPSSLLCIFTSLAFKYHLFPFVCALNAFGLSCSFAYFRHKLTHQLAHQLSPLRYSQECDSEYASLVGRPLGTTLSRMFYIALSWLTTALLARFFMSLSVWIQYLLLCYTNVSGVGVILFDLSLLIACSCYFMLTSFIVCMLENSFIHKFARFEKHALAADIEFSVVLKKVLYRIAIYAAWFLSLVLRPNNNNSIGGDKMIYSSVEISLLYMFLLHVALAPIIKQFTMQLLRGDEEPDALLALQPCVVLCKLSKKTGYIREHILDNENVDGIGYDGISRSNIKKSTIVSRMKHKLANKLAARTSGRDSGNNVYSLRDSPAKLSSPLTLTKPTIASSSSSATASTTAMTTPQSPTTPDTSPSVVSTSCKMKRLLKSGRENRSHLADMAGDSLQSGQYQTKTNCIYFDDRFLQEDDITKPGNSVSTGDQSSLLRRPRQPSVAFAAIVEEEVNIRKKSLLAGIESVNNDSNTTATNESDSGVNAASSSASSSVLLSPLSSVANSTNYIDDVEEGDDDDIPVNNYHFNESVAVAAAGSDYEVMPLSNQDSLLIQESAQPSFISKHRQTDLLTLLAVTLLFAPFSALLYPCFSVYMIFTYRKHMAELIQQCRRPVIDENKRGCLMMEPFLILAENFSIVAIVTTLSAFYCMGSLWQGSEIPIPLSVMTTLAHVKYMVVGARSDSSVAGNGGVYKIHTYVLLILIEHFAILFRVYVLPRFLKFSVGHSHGAISALERMKEIRENVASRMLFLKDANLKTIAMQLREATVIYDQWRAMIKLAQIQSHIGNSMNPYLWAALSLIPFILHTYFDIAWFMTLIPLFLTCCYYQNRIDRRKRAIAMSMICDTEVFQYVQKELPGFVFDADLQRCEWVNTMLQLTWPQLAQYAENKVRKIVMPALEDNCPPIARRLFLSKLTMGSNPFTVLGMRVLEGKGRRSDFVEMDVDFKWVSNLTMAITMELKVGSVFTLNVSNFQFSGTVRIMCCEKIAANPPFVYAKATFFEKPFVDFSLAFGDTDLMELGPSHGSISTLIQGILKHVLQTMVIYPKWMRVELNDPPEGHAPAPKDPFVITHPEGVLNIIVLNCRNLIIGDISTSDPYVIVRLGQETYTTPVIYKTLNPVWEGANYNFLVHDKSREFLDIEVYDKDQTQKDEFLGKTKVYLDPLLDGSQEKYTLDLMDVRHGKITIALAYMKLAESKKSPSQVQESGTPGGGVGISMSSDAGASNGSTMPRSRNHSTFSNNGDNHGHHNSSGGSAEINLDDLINMTIGNLGSMTTSSGSVARSGSPLKKQNSTGSGGRAEPPMRRSMGQRSTSFFSADNGSSAHDARLRVSSAEDLGSVEGGTAGGGDEVTGRRSPLSRKPRSPSIPAAAITESAFKPPRKSISSFLFSSQNKGVPIVTPPDITSYDDDDNGDNNDDDDSGKSRNATSASAGSNNNRTRKFSNSSNQGIRNGGFGLFRSVDHAFDQIDSAVDDVMGSSPRDDDTRSQQSHITVAGILTVSNITLSKLLTVKGMVSSSHKIVSYCSFNVGHTRRSTIEKYKDANPRFPETFHFVVGDKDQDVLQIKIKQVTNIGLVKTLAVLEVRVKNVVVSANQCLHVTEDLSATKDKNVTLALGASMACELKYRPTARLYSIANNFAK